ncbi:Thioredoxin-like protein [Lachnellula occidentalis]|uniref:Thioredoxin-like protein n=1 Tax=Lachnellula occidentalis TaxID=215460 RepID=A0A8H8S3Q5_9HELO|nr:Thioredoxin-like protein [Lachnellula occidentalis]
MQEIKSLSQFNKLKANPLLIIDFYATWCGPCKVVSPAFDRLAKPHEYSPSIIFAKVDVDKAKDVAQTCGITAMPTFQFFKNGSKVDEVKGADVQQLTTKIGYYTAAAAKENAGQGDTSASGSKSKKADSPAGSGSLRPLIDIDTARLLNNSIISSARNIASPPPAGYAVASASGARLLIHLPFTQAVSPSHLHISIAKDSLSNAPSRIQVGTNVPVRVTKSPEGVESNDLDMESLVKAENTQAFNVFSDEYVNGKAELKLKTSKFTAIKSLTIRVDANLSGDEKTITKIGTMDIIGSKV